MEGRHNNLDERDVALLLNVKDKKVYLINDTGGRTLELVWRDNLSHPHGEVKYAYFVKGLKGIDISIAYLEKCGYVPVEYDASN